MFVSSIKQLTNRPPQRLICCSTLNMNRFILIFIILLIITPTFGQGFYKIEENFKLLNSGKKKVSVFRGETLIYFKILDSANRIVTKNNIELTELLENNNAPIYDETHSISYTEISFYNTNGIIDSTIIINYLSPVLTAKGESIPAQVDSTLIIYNQTLFHEKILTRNFYKINQGVRVLYRSDHYGYDVNDRLIILIEDGGNTQYNFEYNDDGNISAYYVHGTKVSFEYKELGRKSKDIYVTSINTYEYDTNSMLIKKVTTGKNAGVFTFKYE